MELYKCKDCYNHRGITENGNYADQEIDCTEYMSENPPYIGDDGCGFKVVKGCPREK